VMSYGLTNSTPATIEPITIEEARKHVELPNGYTAHDKHLLRFITAARQRAELITGRQIVTATWDLYLDHFPCFDEPIFLPKPPLQSVTSIVYTSTAGVSTTWTSSEYIVSTHREPGIIRPAFGETYPSARRQLDSIRVRYVAGYGSPTACPELLKAAMLLLLGHWFDHREEVNIGNIVTNVPTAAADILEQYRVGDEFTKYAGSRYAEAY
jgi:uncharacterized phiE125 gp8 family phage protein